MQTVRLALHAMATRFELVLHGEDAVYLRAAGEEALAEIKRLHRRLSVYDPTSEVSHINRNASETPVEINRNLFSLLQMASDLHHSTDGAFDITVGPLMRCWGFMGDSGSWPEEAQRKEALEKTGMDKVELDDSTCTIAFKRDGMAIDLGAIGKGYAIEEATTLLQECGITSALLHGGTSTMAAIGTPSPDEDGWPIGIADPLDQSHVLTSTTIRDEAFSVSAPHGKAFQKDNKIWGHVIDPRHGYPIQGPALSAVVHSSATVCDGISTALLAMNQTEVNKIAQKFNGMRILCAYSDNNVLNLVSNGFINKFKDSQ
ncbi:MAG: FAD:protein FMN transferase [Bacteroidetes bacterium]|nr:FAD:protein FMN transferase [Bacteroidota bacterium]